MQTKFYDRKMSVRPAAVDTRQRSATGELFPDFLLEHVDREWREVEIQRLNPDICLQVDSGLAYCGCGQPSAALRQFIYTYHQSDDFDHETLALLITIFVDAGDQCPVWDELVLLELERDCGLRRADYLAQLKQMAARLETAGPQPQVEAWPQVELRA